MGAFRAVILGNNFVGVIDPTSRIGGSSVLGFGTGFHFSQATKYRVRHFMDIITEAWFKGIRLSNGEVIDVYKNPSRAELMKLINKDEYNSVRALATPTDLYVFTANLSHGDVQTALGWGLWDKARIFIDKQGPYMNENDDMNLVGTDEDYEDEEAREHNRLQRNMVDEWCRDHPVLRHLFPGYTLGIR